MATGLYSYLKHDTSVSKMFWFLYVREFHVVLVWCSVHLWEMAADGVMSVEMVHSLTTTHIQSTGKNLLGRSYLLTFSPHNTDCRLQFYLKNLQTSFALTHKHQLLLRQQGWRSQPFFFSLQFLLFHLSGGASTCQIGTQKQVFLCQKWPQIVQLDEKGAESI